MRFWYVTQEHNYNLVVAQVTVAADPIPCMQALTMAPCPLACR